MGWAIFSLPQEKQSNQSAHRARSFISVVKAFLVSGSFFQSLQVGQESTQVCVMMSVTENNQAGLETDLSHIPVGIVSTPWRNITLIQANFHKYLWCPHPHFLFALCKAGSAGNVDPYCAWSHKGFYVPFRLTSSEQTTHNALLKDSFHPALLFFTYHETQKMERAMSL